MRAAPLPRCLLKAEAAAYCSVTPQGFDLWRRRGLVPGPLPGTQRWDRKALDLALDRLSGITAPVAVPPGAAVDDSATEAQDATRRRYAEWKARREGRA